MTWRGVWSPGQTTGTEGCSLHSSLQAQRADRNCGSGLARPVVLALSTRVGHFPGFLSPMRTSAAAWLKTAAHRPKGETFSKSSRFFLHRRVKGPWMRKPPSCFTENLPQLHLGQEAPMGQGAGWQRLASVYPAEAHFRPVPLCRGQRLSEWYLVCAPSLSGSPLTCG